MAALEAGKRDCREEVGQKLGTWVVGICTSDRMDVGHYKTRTQL